MAIESTQLGVQVDAVSLQKNGAVLSIKDDGVTESKIKNLGTGAQGDIIYVDSTPELKYLTAGTTNQVLQTKGAGQNPVWANMQMTLIEHKSLSASASATFSGLSGYLYYILMVHVNSSAALSYRMTLNGSASGYVTAQDSGVGVRADSGNTTFCNLVAFTAADQNYIGTITIAGDVSDASNVHGIQISGGSDNTACAFGMLGRWVNASSVSSIELVTSTGTVNGTATLYGVKST